MQQLAAAAVRHTAACGGKTPVRSLLNRMANIASRGIYRSNAERDLHHVVRNLKLNVKIDKIRVRFTSPATAEIKAVQLPCLMPDEFALKIWSLGEEYFRYYFLGNQNPADLWNHVRGTPWGAAATAEAGSGGVDKLIPITFYGDEIYTYKNTDCGVIVVLAWGADYVTAALGPLDRYFLITGYSQYLQCEHTWPDLAAELTQRFKNLVSLTHWPWCKKGWKFHFSSVTGDLKWIKDHFQMQDYAANAFCSYCPCVKKDAAGRIEHTLSDFRETAAHRRVRVLHENFLANTALQDRALSAYRSFWHCSIHVV